VVLYRAPRCLPKIGGFDESLHLGGDVNLICRASGMLASYLCIENVGRTLPARKAVEFDEIYMRVYFAADFAGSLSGLWQKIEYQAAPYAREE